MSISSKSASTGTHKGSKKPSNVVFSAIYFALGTLSSRFLGLARDILLLSFFDKTALDAWYAAFRLPNSFRRLFGEGALSATFLPVYVETKEHRPGEVGALLAGVLGLLLLVLSGLTVLALWQMDSLIGYWLSGKGFSEVPGKLELTTGLARIMFPFLLLMSFYAFMMALLNAHKKFFVTSVAPVALNLSLIAVCLIAYFVGRVSPVWLSWAVLIGGLFQCLIVLVPLWRLHLPFEWSFQALVSQPVRKVLRALGPTLAGSGVLQIMALVNTAFASSLYDGAVTQVYYADRLLELPLSLLSVSMGTALLPSLSEHMAHHRLGAFKRDLLKALRALYFVAIPAGVGLWMIGEPLSRLLFQRGAFLGGDIVIIVGLIQVYAFTLIAASTTRILAQCFYSVKDTTTPAIGAVLALAIHWFLAPKLMGMLQLQGLVLSTLLVTLGNGLFLATQFYRRFGAFDLKSLATMSGKSIVSAFGIVAVCWGVGEMIPVAGPGSLSRSSLLLNVLLSLGLSGLAYGVLSVLMKIPEAQQLKRRLLKR